MARSRGRMGEDVWSLVPSEKPLARRRRHKRLEKDARVARAVDRSGSPAHLEHSAKKLRAARAGERVLRTPQKDMALAIAAMERAGVTGIVSNLCGSRRKKVRRKRD